MLTKTLYNLHFSLMETVTEVIYHACAYDLRLQVLKWYANACLQRITINFVEKTAFECCFWSTQCNERHARTSGNVKTWKFSSLNVQWWSFIYNIVYFSILRSNKAEFIDVEKAMFTVATVVPMFTIITPGPLTCSKKPNTFHAKCNLKVYRKKKCLWQPKFIVWMLQISMIQSDISAT